MLRLLLVLFLVLLSGAWFVWQSNRSPDVLAVDLITVESGDVFDGLSLTGELVNDRTVILTALLDGEISAVSAREGDRVEKDQTLAQLNAVAARALLNKAQAELAIARANVADAQRNFTRAQNLHDQGNLSEQLYDEAQLNWTRTQAQETIAQSSVTIAARTVRDATVRAPFDGQVIAHSTEIGQWVEAGTPLFTLVATSGQVIEAYVDATDIAKVTIGQSATLTSDAWPSQPWRNKVEWIAPVIASPDRSRSGDIPPNAIAIRLPVGDEAPALRLGQQVDVELEIERREQVARLPLTALRQTDEGNFEALVISDGEVAAVPVQTGIVTPTTAEIVSGLDVGTQVIGSDVNSLRIGMTVQAR